VSVCTSKYLSREVSKHNLFYASRSTSLLGHEKCSGFRRNPTDDAHEDNIISTENIISDSWTSVDRDTCLLGRRKMQWVHMVCGLWTPGTKCPNATTMSAFDVSGASPGKRNTVSSVHAYSSSDYWSYFSTPELYPVPCAALGHRCPYL
jgi:hypothetical protein